MESLFLHRGALTRPSDLRSATDPRFRTLPRTIRRAGWSGRLYFPLGTSRFLVHFAGIVLWVHSGRSLASRERDFRASLNASFEPVYCKKPESSYPERFEWGREDRSPYFLFVNGGPGARLVLGSQGSRVDSLGTGFRGQSP